MASRAFRRLSFKTPKREPVVLDINGTEFECRAILPGFVLLDLMAALNTESYSLQVQSFRDLFSAVMEDEEHDRFLKFCMEASSGVDAAMLIEVAKGLAEEYVQRPTQPSAPSARGRSKTRTTSKAG